MKFIIIKTSDDDQADRFETKLDKPRELGSQRMMNAATTFM